MPQVVNTNVPSLTAQNNLNKSQKSLTTSLQRLSSGLRINSAKDDAAGLAISNRFTTQIRGLSQAVRNANDGVSISQVAEGALQETTNILQRMRELAVQSSNGTNGIAEREALQAEVTQLQGEVDRIANTTRFGSRNVLNGTFTNVALQVGAFAAETINISIASARGADLGRVNTLTLTGFATADASATSATPTSLIDENQTLTFTVDGTATDVAVSTGDSAQLIADNINSQVGSVSADAKTTARVILTADAGADTFDVTINGVQLTTITGATTVAEASTALKAAIDSDASLSNLTVTDAGTHVDIVDETGANITFDTIVLGASTATVAGVKADGTTLGAAGAQAVTTAQGHVVSGDITFTTTAGQASMFSSSTTGGVTLSGTAAAGIGTIVDTNERVSTIDISDFAGAQSAIDIIDAALTSIDTQRGDLGAIQNRMEFTISNLSAVVENVSAARSRILDADFAAETANLTRAQILQQAGTAMLSQANSLPQNVLSLLQ